MRNEPIDEQYLVWLYGQVANVKAKSPSRTYWELFRTLYKKEFVWYVPNDNNRVEDGRDLRKEFYEEYGLVEVDPGWSSLGCSMLEMLVALARRVEFQAGGTAKDWFWGLVENLELAGYNDRDGFSYDDVDESLNRVIFRTYYPDGRGGLFPLKFPDEDQRDIEIWYQMCAYVIENFY